MHSSVEPEYVNDVELARRTGMSRAFFQQARVRGGGPPYYRVGRRCLYRWTEVAAWIEARRVDSSRDELPTRITLDDASFTEFSKAMVNPPRPNAKLRGLLKK